MRRSFILACVVVTVTVLLLYFYWPKKDHIDPQTEKKELIQAQQLLDQSKDAEALEIIQKYDQQLIKKDETGEQWRQVFIKANENTQNLIPLYSLYQYFPESFKNHEKASIIVGSILLREGKNAEYDELRQNWKGREVEKEEWFFLDANKFTSKGQNEDAIRWLKTKTFTGQAEVNRLVKLALLSVYDYPREAWEYLNQAIQKDPNNPMLVSYRAKLLEVVDNKPLAHLQYLAAVQTDPTNIFYRDQLADFYLRSGDYQLALKTWAPLLTPNANASLWLKVFFWNKVITPVKVNWSSVNVPESNLKSLLNYLFSLKPDQFWDKALFDTKVNGGIVFLKNNQSTFWLRLLQNLKEGNEKAATELVDFTPFSGKFWDPQLFMAIKKMLQYRQSKTLDVKDSKLPQQDTLFSKDLNEETKLSSILLTHQHPFFKQINDSQNLPQEVESFILSNAAFVAPFLAAGWYEAALQLNDLKKIPEQYPDWIAFGLTQALRQNRSDQEALTFALNQKETPELNLLIGELTIATGKTSEGIERLQKLAKEANEIGYKANTLISHTYLQKGEIEKVKEHLKNNLKFAESIPGQVIQAQIYLKENKTAEAEKIYFSIKNESPEAKLYLARKAYLDKDFTTAQKLTEELLKLDPTNVILQENYQKILSETQKQHE